MAESSRLWNVREESQPTPAPVVTRLTRLKDIERAAILAALQENGGNRTHTAAQLGISLRTLQYRLKEYGVNP